MDTRKWIGLAAIVVVVVVSFLVGNSRGYNKAQTDVKKAQDEAAQNASADAAKAANPFQAVNPVAGVEANPFAKAKDVLNPFK